MRTAGGTLGTRVDPYQQALELAAQRRAARIEAAGELVTMTRQELQDALDEAFRQGMLAQVDASIPAPFQEPIRQ